MQNPISQSAPNRLWRAEFLNAMQQWVAAFAGALRGQGIAIDGKTLRGSYDTAAGQSPLQTITAFAVGTRTCLRQMVVGDSSNEIPAVPLLLRMLELEGAIVTLDAMHCQTRLTKRSGGKGRTRNHPNGFVPPTAFC